MSLVLYNTLTRTKEPFEPLQKGKIGMYVCGVTVYHQSHLGHAKSAINFDVIVRWLRHKGYDVKHVTNFTDVDDKVIARANEIGMNALDLSKRLIEDYFKDMDALKIKRADAYPKASETVPDIIDMIRGLIDKGYAYESQGSVYFSVRKAKEYGKLSGQSYEQTQAGARIEPGEDKREPMDFALWKAAKPGEVFWESPWGKGRPGWHIECSAMCLKYIGKTVDIHGGGTDLIFPHHENEILQSEAYNDAPFVRYWMHNGMLTIDQEKMSKSLKNFFLIGDILKKHSPEVVRFYLLNANYRQPLDYSETSLEEAGRALDRLQNTYDTMKEAALKARGADDAEALCEKTKKDFESKMDDDFNTREAVAVVYDLARDANKLWSDGTLSRNGASTVVATLSELNDVLDILREKQAKRTTRVADEGLDFPDPQAISTSELSDEEIDMWLQRREAARKRKDFSYADGVRKRLAEVGIEIQDTKDGATWKRK